MALNGMGFARMKDDFGATPIEFVSRRTIPTIAAAGQAQCVIMTVWLGLLRAGARPPATDG